MAVEVQDVLNANLVLLGVGLLNTPEEVENFGRAVNTDVTFLGAPGLAGLIMGMVPDGSALDRAYALNKDRIALSVSPTRSAITRDYPRQDDLDRLAEVASHAITSTMFETQQRHPVGYNIALVYDPKSESKAFSYLADRLFDKNTVRYDQWQLAGGSGKLMFVDGHKTWTAVIEPRVNDEDGTNIFLTLNLHIGSQPLPSDEEIRNGLNEVWNQALNFANWLDESK